MISPAEGHRFGLLLRQVRDRLAVRQEDVAQALGVDRSLISQWERDVFKRPVTAEDVNNLAFYFKQPVIEWVLALGYKVEFEGIEDEQEVTLLGLFRQARPEYRRAVIRGLQEVASAQGGAT